MARRIYIKQDNHERTNITQEQMTEPKFLTVPVDEFMTTKMYNGDKQTVLKAVQRREGHWRDSPGLAMV
jgi:hypothetical protein